MLNIRGINNINLEIKEGEFCIIIGNDNSGESSLLQTIIGEHNAGFGQIYLGNKEISKMPMYQRAGTISFVGYDIADDTIGEMTLFENLVLSYLRGKPPSLRLYSNYFARMRSIISELGFGLEKYLHAPIGTLSLDQKTIVSILMALISNTKLFLLDECTNHMDPRIRSRLMKYIAQKIELAKITTLMVTNNLNDALEYGNRVIIFHNGRIAKDISGSEKLSLTKDHLTRLLLLIDDEERYK